MDGLLPTASVLGELQYTKQYRIFSNEKGEIVSKLSEKGGICGEGAKEEI
jgi:hypothetical protein